jgi:Xaa-Pro aminopeptidase
MNVKERRPSCQDCFSTNHATSSMVCEHRDIFDHLKSPPGAIMPKVATLSLAERDRRWAAVRKAMEQEGINCLVGFPNMGEWDHFQANVRYLTQVGGFSLESAVVFPLSGDVYSIVRGNNEVSWWKEVNQWITNYKTCGRRWSQGVVDALKELDITRGKIGVMGLGDTLRSEGLASWNSVERVKQSLPSLTLVDSTELISNVRSVKSEEEVSFLQKAVDIAENTALAMVETAKPGVNEREVYAAMIRSNLVQGSDFPFSIHLGIGQKLPWPNRFITTRTLQQGDIINNEIGAKWAGYRVQIEQPMILGHAPADLSKQIEASKTAFDKISETMRPGVTVGEVVKVYKESMQSYGFGTSAALFHGMGLGEDGPLILTDAGSKGWDRKFQAGNTFVLKPCPGVEGVEEALRVGDTVAVTNTGARRLGKRELRLIEKP